MRDRKDNTVLRYQIGIKNGIIIMSSQKGSARSPLGERSDPCLFVLHDVRIHEISAELYVMITAALLCPGR